MRRTLVLLGLFVVVPASQAAPRGGTPVALVTAETQNALLAVALPSGRVLRRIPLPAQPENVETLAGASVVVSTRGHAASILVGLRVVKVLHDFSQPHIVAMAPSGDWAYVSDDARGTISVIDLAKRRVVHRVFVGRGAHHMSFSPDQRRLWVALGERARSIVVLDTTRTARPRVIGHVDPHGLAHDLAFSPSGRAVWVAYDDRSQIGIFSARTGRLVRMLPSGPPPQHVAFDQLYRLATYATKAYVTSGSDGTLRVYDVGTRRLLRTLHTSLGSFNLSVRHGTIAVSSLYGGALTELSPNGRVMVSRRLAPATRDVAITTLP